MFLLEAGIKWCVYQHSSSASFVSKQLVLPETWCQHEQQTSHTTGIMTSALLWFITVFCALKRQYLSPSHNRRWSAGFWTVHQRRYKILLLCPVWGVCAARQLVQSIVALHQKRALHGIELILFLMPDAWQWPIRARASGSYSGLRSKHQKWLISTRTIF